MIGAGSDWTRGGSVEAGISTDGSDHRGDSVGVRWYLMFPISYRDLTLMKLDRGVEVDGPQRDLSIDPGLCRRVGEADPAPFAAEQRLLAGRRHRCSGEGRWTYLYQAVDSRGRTIDFLLSARRNATAAKRFFRNALAQPPTVNPRTITVGKNPAYPKAVTEIKQKAELWRRSRLRQVRYLNNVVEQDHRHVKRLIRPGLGFGEFWTARRTLADIEAMAMIRRGQIRQIGGGDIRAQGTFITGLFQMAA
jgi:transposase-like protein